MVNTWMEGAGETEAYLVCIIQMFCSRFYNRLYSKRYPSDYDWPG